MAEENAGMVLALSTLAKVYEGADHEPANAAQARTRRAGNLGPARRLCVEPSRRRRRGTRDRRDSRRTAHQFALRGVVAHRSDPIIARAHAMRLRLRPGTRAHACIARAGAQVALFGLPGAKRCL